MALRLNKLALIFVLLLLYCAPSFSQEETEELPTYKDYKDKDQFKKFYKRRRLISAWQINQLKNGALVVRLKTNKKLIDALLKKGDQKLALQKKAETFIINKNTMMAYLRAYNFSKLYFIYSNSSDTLLNGARRGIFLDTNLKVDPNIVMNEKFYLIAERDYTYNSSIGFVKEDSAKFITEAGTPIREMGVVIKNKFGHQLNAPFPYYITDKTFSNFAVDGLAVCNSDNSVFEWISYDGSIEKNKIRDNFSKQNVLEVGIKKQFTSPKLMLIIEEFNTILHEYFQSTPPPDPSRIDAQTQQFLY